VHNKSFESITFADFGDVQIEKMEEDPTGDDSGSNRRRRSERLGKKSSLGFESLFDEEQENDEEERSKTRGKRKSLKRKSGDNVDVRKRQTSASTSSKNVERENSSSEESESSRVMVPTG
jgi:hypothetical protein